MSITSKLASRIWRQKAQFGSLYELHIEFDRWGGKCSYETFRQFANESTQGTGKLVNKLDKFLTELENKPTK